MAFFFFGLKEVRTGGVKRSCLKELRSGERSERSYANAWRKLVLIFFSLNEIRTGGAKRNFKMAVKNTFRGINKAYYEINN